MSGKAIAAGLIGITGAFLAPTIGYATFGSQKDKGKSNFAAGSFGTLATLGVTVATGVAGWLLVGSDVAKAAGQIHDSEAVAGLPYGVSSSLPAGAPSMDQMGIGLLDIARRQVGLLDVQELGAMTCRGCYN